MNEEVTARFLAHLAHLAKLQDAGAYADCFPYQSLLTEAPIQAFYDFYGIGKQR